MHAAVVQSFDQPPAFLEVPAPEPGADGLLLDVVAAAIHPRVRSQAAGTHYTSTDELPLIPGIDGVGRAADGSLRYFVLADTRDGSMAEQVVVDPRRSAVLPEGVDPVLIAAAMNPAMSSWMALTQRIVLPAGARVLVLGATGSAGRLAVQIAKHLGASYVTAAGRDVRKLAALPALGADALIELGDGAAAGFAEAGRELDIVLDYVWGDATAAALRAIVPARKDDGRPLRWVEIGSMGGLESPIPSAALRATDLRLLGSGQGSVTPSAIVAELPALATEISYGGYNVPTRVISLRDVTTAWSEETDERIVLVP